MARKDAAAAAETIGASAARTRSSRGRIVDAALRLIDTEGLEAVTMPRGGPSLAVGTMSLYRHVEGQGRSCRCRRCASPRRRERARRRPERLGRPRRRLPTLPACPSARPPRAFEHPRRAWPDRRTGVQPARSNPWDSRAAGFSDIDAVRAFHTLFTYVFGFVIWELPRVHQQPPASYIAAWNNALDELIPTRTRTFTLSRTPHHCRLARPIRIRTQSPHRGAAPTRQAVLTTA